MSFREILGHEQVHRQLAQAVRSGRLAHAYLFVGPEGVGKRTFAQQLAKTLLCENRDEVAFDSCDRCAACRWVEAQTHPDYRYISLPSDKHEFPIELIHEVIRLLGVKSACGRQRVVLLDDADTLNEESANAFLKTLEEPPPDSLLILLGTSPDYQLPTIRSRCQLVRFSPLEDDLVASWLRQQGLVKSQAEAQRIARLARGSLAQAQLLAQVEVWTLRQKLGELLSAGRSDALALTQLVLPFIETAGQQSALQRRRAHLAVAFLVDLLRGALAWQLGISSNQAFSSHDQQCFQALAARTSASQLLHALDRCLLADYQIDRRLHLALVIEALADSLSGMLLRSERDNH